METQYSSLAELRNALTADDADQRASAYGSVMGEDLKPSQLLGNDPDEAAVSTLVEAGVIPEDVAGDGRSAGEREEEIVELLREIRDAVEGSNA